MIDNAVYIKILMKKWAAGTLTELEKVELEIARQRYSEEDWFHMEIDACCEVEDEQPEKPPVDWQPVWERARALERSQQRKTLRNRVAACLGGTAVFMVLLWWVLPKGADTPRSIRQDHNSTMWTLAGDIPASDMACTVWLDDTTAIAVDGDSQGLLGAVGNVEIWRHPDGVVALLPKRYPAATDSVGPRSVRVTTRAYQQCLLLLPDGTEIRMDAGSELRYPLTNLGQDITRLDMSGRALVALADAEGESGKPRLILHTSDAHIQSWGGAFTVLDERRITRTVLLAGRIEVRGRQTGEGRQLKQPGDALSLREYRLTREGENQINLAMHYVGKAEALAWTLRDRSFCNMPVADFVFEMSRWHGFNIETMACLPAERYITADFSYKDPINEVFAQLYEVGIFMVERNGMISFCPPDAALESRDVRFRYVYKDWQKGGRLPFF